MKNQIGIMQGRIYPDIPTPTQMKAGSFLDAEFTIRFKAESSLSPFGYVPKGWSFKKCSLTQLCDSKNHLSQTKLHIQVNPM